MSEIKVINVPKCELVVGKQGQITVRLIFDRKVLKENYHLLKDKPEFNIEVMEEEFGLGLEDEEDASDV